MHSTLMHTDRLQDCLIRHRIGETLYTVWELLLVWTLSIYFAVCLCVSGWYSALILCNECQAQIYYNYKEFHDGNAKLTSLFKTNGIKKKKRRASCRTTSSSYWIKHPSKCKSLCLRMQFIRNLNAFRMCNHESFWIAKQ